ncbi:MAG: hypothetical protein AAF235_00125 [Planctomycetota bacterium]
MHSSEVIDHIQAFDMDALRASLSEAPDPEDGSSLDDVIQGATAWLDTLRADMKTLVRQIGEGEDVEMALAIQYVELKRRWIAFNTKMNYTMFKGTTPSVTDMCRAASVSAFLGHMETLLRPGDIEHITEFLAKPLNEAA